MCVCANASYCISSHTPSQNPHNWAISSAQALWRKLARYLIIFFSWLAQKLIQWKFSAKASAHISDPNKHLYNSCIFWNSGGMNYIKFAMQAYYKSFSQVNEGLDRFQYSAAWGNFELQFKVQDHIKNIRANVLIMVYLTVSLSSRSNLDRRSL